MNTDNGALDFEAYINNERLYRTAQEAENRIKGITKTAVSESEKMDSAFGNIGKYVAGYFGVQALTGFTTQLVKVRGEFQQLDVAFSTMLGSKEKSDKLMAQLVDTAAKTPFTLQQVAGGAKQLLAYQVAAEDVNNTVIRLGNIAAGVSVPLDRLILAYGQVKAKGKLQGDDMRQFTEAGIPIIHELAKVMGVADNQIQKMVEDGKIGFPQVQQVIQNLTNEGGMFYNLMEKQSKTLTGQISNLEDAWSRMLNSIGQSNEGAISGAISGATYLVDHYQQVLDIIIPIVAAYGAYKTALIVTAIAQKAIAAATFVQKYIAMGTAVGFATANQTAFNTAVLANPYAIAAAAIVGLIAVIYTLSDAENNLTETEKAKQSIHAKASQQYDEQKAKITSLISVLNNEKVALDQRQKALKDIQAVIPNYHASLTTEGKLINDNKTAIDDYLKSLEKQIYLQATMDEKIELTKKKRLLEKEVAKKEQNAKDAEAAASVQVIGSNGIAGTDGRGLMAAQARSFANSAKADLAEVNNALSELDKEYINISNSTNDAAKGTDQVILKNKVFWETQKKEAQDRRDALPDTEKGSTKWKEYSAQIAEAEKHLQAYNTKAGEKAAKDQKKADEDFAEEKLKAQKKYDDMELALLRSKITDKKDLIDLELEQTLAGIDEMQKAYIEKSKAAGVSNPDISIFTNMRTTAKNQAVSDKKSIDTEADKKALDELLGKFKDTQQKMVEAKKKYDDDMIVLNKAMADANASHDLNKAIEVQNTIKERTKQFKVETAGINVDNLMNSEDWTTLFGNLETLSVNKMIELRDKLEAEWSKLNLSPDQLKALRDQLDKVNGAIEKKNPFKALADAVEKYDQKDPAASMKKVTDAVVESANYINGNLQNVFGALDSLGVKGMDEAKQIANDVTNLVGDGANLAMGIATGNPLQIIQASISLITDGIKMITGIHDRALERDIVSHQKAIEELKTAYDELSNAVDKALGTEKYELQRKEIENLKKQQKDIQSMFEDETAKKKTDEGKLKEYRDQYKSLSDQQIEIIDNMKNQLLGSDIKSMADDLGSALIDAFNTGENAAEAWGKKVDDIVKNVVKNLIIQSAIEKPVAAIIDKYVSKWVDANGNLTMSTDQMLSDSKNLNSDLKAWQETYGKGISNLLGQYTGTSDPGSTKTLSGAISGMSEETASILSGYANAIRINQIESISVMRNQLIALNMIASNTSYNINLVEILSVLKQINGNGSLRSQGL